MFGIIYCVYVQGYFCPVIFALLHLQTTCISLSLKLALKRLCFCSRIFFFKFPHAVLKLPGTMKGTKVENKMGANNAFLVYRNSQLYRLFANQV